MATNIPTVEEFNEELPVSSWDRNTVADGNWLQANTIGPLKNRDDKIIELLQGIEAAGNSWKNWSEDNDTHLEDDNNYYIGSGNSALGDAIVIGNNNKVKNSTVYGSNNDVSATNSTNDIRIVTGMAKNDQSGYYQTYETIQDVPTQGLVVGSDNYSETFNPIIIGTHNSASIDGSYIATLEQWNKDGVMTPNYPIAIGVANKSYRNFDTSIGTNNVADGGFNFIYGVNNSAFGTQNVILNTNGTYIYGHQNYAYGPASQLITLSGNIDTEIDNLVPDSRRYINFKTKNVLYNAAVTIVERFDTSDTMVTDSIFKDCNIWFDPCSDYSSIGFSRNEFNKCYFIYSASNTTPLYNKYINLNKIEGGTITVNSEHLTSMCHNNLRFGSNIFSIKPWSKPPVGDGIDGMRADINAEYVNFNDIYLENGSHGFGLSGILAFDFNKIYNTIEGNYINIGYSGFNGHYGNASVHENLIYQSIFDIKYDRNKHLLPGGIETNCFSNNILFDSVYVVNDEDLQSYTIDTNATYWTNGAYNSNILINTNIYNSREIVSIASKKALNDFMSMSFTFYNNKDGDTYIGFDTQEEADAVLADIKATLTPYNDRSDITWSSPYLDRDDSNNTWIILLYSFSYFIEDPVIKAEGEALANSLMALATVKRSDVKIVEKNSSYNIRAGIKNSESVVSIGNDNELSASVSTHIFGFNNNLTGAENSVVIGNHNVEFITPISYVGKTEEEAVVISNNRPALYDTVILGSNNTVSSNALSGETDYEDLNTIARNVYIGFNNDILINKLVADNYVIGNNNNVLNGKNLFRNKIIGLDNSINSGFSDCNIIGGHNQLVNNTEGIFENNTILGMYNLVKFGSNSTLIGHHNTADGYNGVAIGEGLSATNSQIVIGRFNEALPGTDDRDTYDVTAGALFIVGNGYHAGNDFDNPTRSNAMVVSADGTVSAKTYKADPGTPLGKLFDFLATFDGATDGDLHWDTTTSNWIIQ